MSKLKKNRALIQFSSCALFTLVNAAGVFIAPEGSRPLCFMAMALCGVATVLIGLEIKPDDSVH
jgi:hypothetical protein